MLDLGTLGGADSADTPLFWFGLLRRTLPGGPIFVASCSLMVRVLENCGPSQKGGLMTLTNHE